MRLKAPDLAELLVRVVSSELCPVMVGMKIQIFIVVFPKLIVNIDCRDGVIHLAVHVVDGVVLISAVDGFLNVLREVDTGTAGNDHDINIGKISNIIFDRVDHRRIIIGRFLIEIIKLEGVAVRNIYSSGNLRSICDGTGALYGIGFRAFFPDIFSTLRCGGRSVPGIGKTGQCADCGRTGISRSRMAGGGILDDGGPGCAARINSRDFIADSGRGCIAVDSGCADTVLILKARLRLQHCLSHRIGIGIPGVHSIEIRAIP